MVKAERGFTLVELVTVMVLIGIISVSMFSRIGAATSANVQAGRDDLIAALFFAQQTAMARSGITLTVNNNVINVTENGSSIIVKSVGYPLNLPVGVNASNAAFVYDKLGRTTASAITLTGSSGASATITVAASGYAY
jgi:MSHA pilin protein MshC